MRRGNPSSFSRETAWLTGACFAMWALVGCAHYDAPKPKSTTPNSAASQADDRASERSEAPRVTDQPALYDARAGVINRAALRRLVEAGAPSFIAQIDVRASFKRRRFWGWRVLQYSGPGQLAPGDIVRRINGFPIERPDQFIRVWNALPAQPEISIELVRAGKQHLIRLPIVD
ncbi:MAG: hypothetical protein H6707_21415 [Deltaproteobacteria bacterium]|nr:hypothetical protein [Deltaproteobacteria bacterium]